MHYCKAIQSGISPHEFVEMTQSMQLTSSAFTNNQEIPALYTCKETNINPPLTFSDIPEGTKSLVLVFQDNDATPVPWVHWLVFNILPTTKEVTEGAIPEGSTEGLANNKSFGYEGPCPKYFKGIHHYVFTLYALNIILNIPKESDKEAVEKAMQGHILKEATLTGIQTGSGEARE